MIINRLYRYNLTYFLFRAHTSILSALAKNPFQTILGTMAAMERENISFRLQSEKEQYIIMAIFRDTQIFKQELSDKDGIQTWRSKRQHSTKIKEGVLFIDIYLERGVISLFLYLWCMICYCIRIKCTDPHRQVHKTTIVCLIWISERYPIQIKHKNVNYF